ncbi:acyltransferase family protein [Litoreibacter roseus]|uniref:Acyltransferase n=1 Tax=Litoreibacter roseus TaxID=2601869 RepID=A0A6N6JIN8_9RHOB|nr:acyltransferase family protein [Litoreibacter roseus]GFE66223.1 acyltransferase [Litoreibacter roseus]
MKYRAEIDGLRAIAVVPVVLFHTGIEAFSAGFVGVDIFFVISGYLITSLILKDLETGDFRLTEFYERRARRILPALVFVSLFCIPMAWIWLLPNQFKDFSESLISVALFASNFYFWSDIGYFSSAAEELPLLHTWSLAVEEQFYIFFPLMLMATWRFGLRPVFWIIAALSAASIVWCLWIAEVDAAANFYLLPSRMWELFAGAMVACATARSDRKDHNGLAFLGLVFVALSLIISDKNQAWPGVITLLPVIGVVLIIFYGGQETFTGRLLATKPLVAIGLISYSTYLWHQPLYAFARISGENLPDPRLLLSLGAFSFGLGFLTWRFVERPFRQRSFLSRRTVIALSGSALALVALLGGIGVVQEGFPKARFSTDQLAIIEVGEERALKHDRLGLEAVAPNWIVLGDSHVNALLDALDDLFRAKGEAAIVHTVNGCPPALDLWRHDLNYGMRCHEKYKTALDILKSRRIENVFINARFSLYLNSTRFDNGLGGVELGGTPEVIYDHIDHKNTVRAFEHRSHAVETQMIEYARALSDLGLNIFVLTSIPEIGWDVPRKALHRKPDEAEVRIPRATYDARNTRASGYFDRLRTIPRVTLIDAAEALCDAQYCEATQNGLPLYFDTNHPNVLGAERLIKHLAPRLR